MALENVEARERRRVDLVDLPERQVQGAKVALQHNLGLGGACVMTMYRRN